MKSLLKFALLSCLLLLFVFGDWATAQPWQNPNATAKSKDVHYEGIKLGVDTPRKVLEEALFAGFDIVRDADIVRYAANFYLGQCYLVGYNGCPKNKKMALDHFVHLFDNILWNGPASIASFENIERWGWTFSAVAPSGSNQRIVRPLPANAKVSFNDLLAAYMERLRKDAEQGNAKAQFELGMYYAIGMGVPSDPKESVKWIRQAANKGNTDAQFTLALYYAGGYGGLPVSKTGFEQWFRRAAPRGTKSLYGGVSISIEKL